MSVYIFFNVFNVYEEFITNAYFHSLDTRNENNLYIPVLHLYSVQKGVSYSGVQNL